MRGSLASIAFFLGLQLRGRLLQLGLLLRREEERGTDPPAGKKQAPLPAMTPAAAVPAAAGSSGAAASASLEQRERAVEIKERVRASRMPRDPTGGLTAPFPSPPRSAPRQELKQLEEQLRAAGANLTPKNWPFCCPVLYHNIAEEVPEDMQVCVTRCYYTYLGLIVCFFWNTISVMGAGFALNKEKQDDLHIWYSMLIALIYALCGIPLAFILWYYRLYSAAVKDKGLTYFWFFCMYFVHIVVVLIAAIGPPLGEKSQMALCGIMTMIEAYNAKKDVGIMYTVGFVLWALETIASVYVLSMAYAKFRGRGHTMEGIKQEAKQEAARTSASMI